MKSAMKSLKLWIVLIGLAIAQNDEEHEKSDPDPHYEYRPYDGWYNNRPHPDWGGAETAMIRILSTHFSDGTYEPAGTSRPNPIELSTQLMSGDTGHGSYKNRTAFLVFFGQQVVEEILDAQRPGCPPEYFNIHVPVNDTRYNPHHHHDFEMPFLRSRYDQRTGLSPNNPRQTLNEISSYIDGTLVYGPNKAWTDGLRYFKFGRLAATNDTDNTTGNFPALNQLKLPMANPPPPADHKLKPINRFFKLGNPRGNENPFLLTFGILWFRYHNYIARQIYANHPTWKDETIFNEARRRVIGQYQKIVMYDWIPSWLGEELDDYTGYDPNVHPGISHVFQSAAMRFGHTLVPPGVYRRSANCTFRTTSDVTGFEGHKALRTCNTYWNPQDAVRESDIDELLMGMASQITEREDNIITPDLRGDVFGPLEFSRRDLMAINIQRGRDTGLPDYNTARVELGLKKRERFEDINPMLNQSNPELFPTMSRLYSGDINNVDIWVGGLLETTPEGPGELFRKIISDQFNRIRNGDRLWFENRNNGLYTDEEIAEIWNTTVKDIILLVTDITDEDIQDNPFFFHFGEKGQNCQQPAQLNHSNIDHLAKCTEFKTFDYFSESSTISFILSFLACGIFLIVCICLLWCLAKNHDLEVEKARKTQAKYQSAKIRDATIAAREWQSPKLGFRPVHISLDKTRKYILLHSIHGKVLRTIDLKVPIRRQMNVNVMLSGDKKMRTMMIRVKHEYDLIVQFSDINQRTDFLAKIRDFFTSIGIKYDTKPVMMSEKMIFRMSFNKEDRTMQLEKFFRVTLSHAFKYGKNMRINSIEGTREIFDFQMTVAEFAEYISLKPNSLFVTNMVAVIDKDGDGYLSFREFLDFIVIFAKGSGEEKARLLFDMYDLGNNGYLTREDFKTMLKSMLDLASETIEDDRMDELVDTMFESANLNEKQQISFQDFQALLEGYKDELNYASLANIDDPNAEKNGNEAGKKEKRRENAPTRARKTLHKAYRSDHKVDNSLQRRFTVKNDEDELGVQHVEAPSSPTQQRIHSYLNFIDNNRRQIFWLVLYTLVSIGIFAERAYYYSVEREHAGLRRIAGYGVTVTRGAASGMMFTYSCLLVTMCRNLITYGRETFLNRIIPFDSYINFHKYIAMLALFFTVVHIIGHGLNFYHINTQTADDLTCLFTNFFHATDELTDFTYWCWQTLTGFTGVLLTLLVVLMYIFAMPFSRRHAFRAFWFTHHLYVLLFVLMILHGAGRLVQPPFTHYFLLGPVVLYTLDKLVSVSRKKIEIAVVKADTLPSDVTYLEFKKPQNFEYKSGQWVRIACLKQGKNEYHPFTLTSAPHEDNLSCHIRAVGPWTTNLRLLYDPSLQIVGQGLPKIYLDGPYGEGHQDWYKYEVAVLVGGGIGVTPFASILKDIAYRSKNGGKIACKKVYFLWVTRTQRQFEWMTDIIRQVEEQDSSDIVSTHIFITQFKEKFDIRTTMLYICERHFQKISQRSLFTGLRSITHFGRPDFPGFFKLLLSEHPMTNVFGVFSCGPPPMTNSVESSCSEVNKYTKNALFIHHYENF